MKRVYLGIDNRGCTPNKVPLVERNTTPQGLPLVNSYAVANKSPHDLFQLATEIQKADSFIRADTQNKLHNIGEQMRFLQEQAEKVLLEAEEHRFLHHVACNFVKYPGNIYHLYERESGQCYFSMLSPNEWGSTGPVQDYKGSYRLEHDHSWTPLSKIKIRDAELASVNRLIDTNETLLLIE